MDVQFRRYKMDWFEFWQRDKESMIATMINNLISDLDNGYGWNSKVITAQRQMIDDYEKEYDQQMKALGLMGERDANWWCYVDLKRRGAIS